MEEARVPLVKEEIVSFDDKGKTVTSPQSFKWIIYALGAALAMGFSLYQTTAVAAVFGGFYTRILSSPGFCLFFLSYHVAFCVHTKRNTGYFFTK